MMYVYGETMYTKETHIIEEAVKTIIDHVMQHPDDASSIIEGVFLNKLFKVGVVDISHNQVGGLFIQNGKDPLLVESTSIDTLVNTITSPSFESDALDYSLFSVATSICPISNEQISKLLNLIPDSPIQSNAILENHNDYIGPIPDGITKNDINLVRLYLSHVQDEALREKQYDLISYISFAMLHQDGHLTNRLLKLIAPQTYCTEKLLPESMLDNLDQANQDHRIIDFAVLLANSTAHRNFILPYIKTILDAMSPSEINIAPLKPDVGNSSLLRSLDQNNPATQIVLSKLHISFTNIKWVWRKLGFYQTIQWMCNRVLSYATLPYPSKPAKPPVPSNAREQNLNQPPYPHNLLRTNPFSDQPGTCSCMSHTPRNTV